MLSLLARSSHTRGIFLCIIAHITVQINCRCPCLNITAAIIGLRPETTVSVRLFGTGFSERLHRHGRPSHAEIASSDPAGITTNAWRHLSLVTEASLEAASPCDLVPLSGHSYAHRRPSSCMVQRAGVFAEIAIPSPRSQSHLLLASDFPFILLRRQPWKIETARYGDISARGRAALTESPDGLACRDIAAAPGRARRADGGRGHICQSRFRRASCLNRTGRRVDWSGVRECDLTLGVFDAGGLSSWLWCDRAMARTFAERMIGPLILARRPDTTLCHFPLKPGPCRVR